MGGQSLSGAGESQSSGGPRTSGQQRQSLGREGWDVEDPGSAFPIPVIPPFNPPLCLCALGILPESSLSGSCFRGRGGPLTVTQSWLISYSQPQPVPWQG